MKELLEVEFFREGVGTPFLQERGSHGFQLRAGLLEAMSPTASYSRMTPTSPSMLISVP